MIAHDSAADKSSSLDRVIDELRSFVQDAARNALDFHTFEQGLHERVLRIGHGATKQFLDAQGSGDLGPSLNLPDGKHVRRLKDLHSRQLMGVFGTFTLARAVYGCREGQKIDFVPLDDRLALPAGKFSYLLEDFNQLLAVEQPFAQVCTTLRRILALEQHVDSLEHQNRQLGQHVEAFRAAQAVPPAGEEGPLLVRTADCKGIPMRRPADAPAIADHEHKRGPKKDRKKMAVLGAVYSVGLWVRTAQDIVAALFRQPATEKPDADRPVPRHKRVIARLNESVDGQGHRRDGMADVFLDLARQLRERNPSRDKVVVNLMDGEERLWQAKELLPGEGRQVDVLDLLHVTPRLWAAARLLAPAANKKAEGHVRDWLLDVLRGRVTKVIGEMARQAEQQGLSRQKRGELAKVCGYLRNNRTRMRYHEYLKAGYPIASGVIEGACRHYVKDRMERTGMSWVKEGAQPMLELRATALNGDWDEFLSFHRQQQTQELHPHRHLLHEVSWPIAS